MKIFKSGALLSNHELIRKAFSLTGRFFSSDVKNINSKSHSIANIDQTQINNEAERSKYNETKGKHFETGVSITSYNTVSFIIIRKKLFNF